jgi:hypothetical protein
MSQTLKISKVKTKERPSPHGKSLLKVLLSKYKARKEAGRIIKSLKEVKDFEAGKKTPKSFEEFLNEI